MKYALPWLTVFAVLLLVSCASKNDANQKNFSAALNSYLAKKGQICLGIPTAWPVDLNEAERRSGMGRAAEMAALEKAGLVRSHETEAEYRPPLGSRPVRTKVLRYELTDSGKTFYREKDRVDLSGNRQAQGDICYGQQALDKILKWEGPTAVGDSKEASVFYTYKIENLAQWADNPEVQRVFPGLVSTIEGATKKTLTQEVMLSNEGWEVK